MVSYTPDAEMPMRVSLTVVAALALCAGVARAQHPTKVEVGTHLGATVHFGSGDAEWSAGAPAPSSLTPPLAWPAFYVTVFATPSVMVEPQVAFAWSSAFEEAIFSGALQLGYLLQPRASSSPYFSLHGGWTTLYGSAKSGFFGGGVGMRFLVKRVLAVRTEARFRRWTCEGCELNEVALNIGLGAALP